LEIGLSIIDGRMLRVDEGYSDESVVLRSSESAKDETAILEEAEDQLAEAWPHVGPLNDPGEIALVNFRFHGIANPVQLDLEVIATGERIAREDGHRGPATGGHGQRCVRLRVLRWCDRCEFGRFTFGLILVFH
jgi:hypothetical protein